ncbi:MAG: SAF domain-containing protein [Ilumatobacteraceae bacterium]
MKKGIPYTFYDSSSLEDFKYKLLHVTLENYLFYGYNIDLEKIPTEDENQNKKIARRSIVAAKQIKIGDVFTKDNIVIKRPGTGRSPIEYWSLLNTKATRDIAENEII